MNDLSHFYQYDYICVDLFTFKVIQFSINSSFSFFLCLCLHRLFSPFHQPGSYVLSFLLFFYSFVCVTETDTKREVFYLLVHSLPKSSRSQEPEDLLRSPRWMAEAQALGTSSIVFPRPLVGSCVKITAAKHEPVPIRDVNAAGSNVTSYTTMQAPMLESKSKSIDEDFQAFLKFQNKQSNTSFLYNYCCKYIHIFFFVLPLLPN